MASYFIPTNETDVHEQWYQLKEIVRNAIGDITPKGNAKNAMWQNSATTVDQLYKDASTFVGYFQNDIMKAVEAMVPGTSDTGFQYVQKNKSSIQAKVNRDTTDRRRSRIQYAGQPDPIRLIGDALRGTLVVDTLEQHRDVISNLTELIESQGNSIVYKNVYELDYDSGYVGIHAKLLLKNQTTKRSILAEVQIHFRSLNDGTLQCPKEYNHAAYEVERVFKASICALDEPGPHVIMQLIRNANLAMRITYLFGLNNIVNGPNSTINASQITLTDPNDCVVNHTSYHFAHGYLLKATYDDEYDISGVQMLSPDNHTWTTCCFLAEINGSVGEDYLKNYYTWSTWIQSEEDDHDGDQSTCISEAEAFSYNQTVQPFVSAASSIHSCLVTLVSIVAVAAFY